jgi:hypothetical protein
MEGRTAEYKFINPSFVTARNLYKGKTDSGASTTFFAVRRSRISHFDLAVNMSQLGVTKWISSIEVGVLTNTNSTVWIVSAQVQFEVQGKALLPCFPTLTCGTGKMHDYFAKVVTGPEDPKLFLHRAGLFVSFFSYHHGEQKNAFPFLGAPCGNGIQGGMYVARLPMSNDIENFSKRSPNFPQKSVPVVLTPKADWKPHIRKMLDNSSDHQSVQKNWGAFSTNTTNSSQSLLWTFSIFPHHVILESLVDVDEAITQLTQLQVEPVFVESTEASFGLAGFYAPIDSISEGTGESSPDSVAHLNINPAHIVYHGSAIQGTYFLGVFHLRGTGVNYDTYLYAFNDKPPFKILAVGNKTLPLSTKVEGNTCEAPSVYVSSLEQSEYEPAIIVTYGVCDLMSRRLNLDLVQVEELLGYLPR